MPALTGWPLLESHVLPAVVEAPPASPWTEFASIGLASLAVVVSLLSHWTAKKSLRIAQEQESRQQPRLDLYLRESLAVPLPTQRGRLLAFNIQVANPRDSDNSVTDAELLVRYTVESMVMTVKVGRAETLPDTSPSPLRLASLTLPAKVAAHDSISGWISFVVPDALTGGNRIERYELSLREVHGRHETLQTTVISEDVHDVAEVDEGED